MSWAIVFSKPGEGVTRVAKGTAIHMVAYVGHLMRDAMVGKGNEK
jgi:hypothetical protein